MIAEISAPIDWVEAVGSLKLPPSTDRHLQNLMDRNTNGQLSSEEKEQLAALVELSESLSLIRTDALRLLHRSPTCQ